MVRQIVLALSSAVLVAGLASCSTTGGDNGQLNPNSPVCQENPFLQKYDCSFDEVKAAAENSDPDAEYALGYMYYYGIETTQDTDAAMTWIKKAAAQGQPLAIKAAKMLQQNPTAPTPSQVAEAKNPVPVSTSSAGSSAAGAANHYTIQLLGSFDRASVMRFQQAQGLSGNTQIIATTYQGKPWYVLTMGDYNTYDAANAARQALSGNLAKQHPWVRTFGSLQQ